MSNYYDVKQFVVPDSLKTSMNSVLNKKLGTTSVNYDPRTWAANVGAMVPLPVKTASGSIAHFEDGADDVPLKSLTANITPKQEGTGDPSPQNPRPIIGTSVLNVTRTGKNLAQFFNDGKVPSISNGALVDYNGNRTDFIKVYPSTNYTLSAVSLSGTCYFFYYDKNKAFISYQQGSIPMTKTTPSNCEYVMLRNDAALSSYEDVQFELGTTATTYESYKGETYTKALGQTVYGGSLNLVSGLLTIKKVKEVRRWDSARSSGSPVGDYWRKSFELANATIASTTNTECSVALYYAAYSSNTLHYYIDSSARLMLFLPNNTADNYEFEICYPLATPIEVQLTPEEVNTFYGANNFWADTGDTEVEYRADLILGG